MFSRTIGGVEMNPWDLDPDIVNPRHIARVLSRINRYAGHWVQPISVARHCVNLAKTVETHGPMVQLQALFHDASEAYTTDIPTPLKNTLMVAHDAEVVPYSVFEDQMLRHIFGLLEIDWPIHQDVWAADSAAYWQEQPILRGTIPFEDTPERAELDFLRLDSALRERLGDVAVAADGVRVQ